MSIIGLAAKPQNRRRFSCNLDDLEDFVHQPRSPYDSWLFKTQPPPATSGRRLRVSPRSIALTIQPVMTDETTQILGAHRLFEGPTEAVFMGCGIACYHTGFVLACRNISITLT